jgi:hypothetical protein
MYCLRLFVRQTSGNARRGVRGCVRAVIARRDPSKREWR